MRFMGAHLCSFPQILRLTRFLKDTTYKSTPWLLYFELAFVSIQKHLEEGHFCHPLSTRINQFLVFAFFWVRKYIRPLTSFASEFMTVTEKDLLESRNALDRTGREIQQAAKYCSGSYLAAATSGQHRTIDDTMNYATQSLGTMIHHINNLALTFLNLLDERSGKLSEVEEKIEHLAMVILYFNHL